jgi:glutamine amidotransferase
MIGIINYGSGNINAIGNIYERLRIPYKIVNSIDELNNVTKIFLPGVGAFDETMSILNNSGFREALDILVLQKKVPVIGICVGMQILAEGSDEGTLPGLGWIKGHVKKLNPALLKAKPLLPHLGWNNIQIKQENPIFSGIDPSTGFYFLHSYYFACTNNADILAYTHYGLDFPSAVCNDNVYGMQFHPEKSHHNGVQLLKNFAHL